MLTVCWPCVNCDVSQWPLKLASSSECPTKCAACLQPCLGTSAPNSLQAAGIRRPLQRISKRTSDTKERVQITTLKQRNAITEATITGYAECSNACKLLALMCCNIRMEREYTNQGNKKNPCRSGEALHISAITQTEHHDAIFVE